MRGWKTNLGGFLKGLGGVALGYVSTALPDIISGAASSGTKTGTGVAIALTIIGDALQRIGIGGKIDKQTDALTGK